ncbi:MAG TPA: cell division protein FtsA, partial [Kofleriaceae bacterium]|nr:cell division protein FtsA [Kofleriaceae bacterium]
IPMDREVLHVLPQQYIIDEQDGVRDPLGMSGVRLEAKVHIATTSVTSAQNVVKCANRCGLQVADIVLEPLASAEAVVEDDEKELGVAMVDVGGGTTDIVIFCDGAIVHTAVLPLGGSHLTGDIAVGLRTPLESAEKIKRKYGCCLPEAIEPDETMEVPSVGGRQPRRLSRRVLVEIVRMRLEEIFEHVKREIARSGYLESIAAGVVMTGGSTLMPGLPDLVESVLGLPARRGAPRGIGGLVDVVRSPEYSTGVGLVLYGARGTELTSRESAPVREGSVFRRMRSWIGEMF